VKPTGLRHRAVVVRKISNLYFMYCFALVSELKNSPNVATYSFHKRMYAKSKLVESPTSPTATADVVASFCHHLESS
jgi:hypothetical protein